MGRAALMRLRLRVPIPDREQRVARGRRARDFDWHCRAARMWEIYGSV